MAGYNQVLVANMALVLLGKDTISALTEDSATGRAVNAIFATTRDATLAMHPWNFAQKRATLALLEEIPAFEYGYYFQLPTDCITVHETDGDENAVSWQVEGRKLAYGDSAVAIRYTRRVTDAAEWSDGFAQVLAARLAHDLTYKLTSSDTKRKELRELLTLRMQEAGDTDGQEGSVDQSDRDPWARARL